MSQIKIIRNESGITKQILNRDVANGDSYNIAQHLWLELANADSIHTEITNGNYIVNNGSEDLSPEVGLVHIQNIEGVTKVHEDAYFMPGVGILAPEPVALSNAAVGYLFGIGDKSYLQFRLDNIVGNEVKIQLHLAIDNSTADRWVAYKSYYRTTTGSGDKTMDSHDGDIETGAIECPTTPYEIFSKVFSIPTNVFDSGEKYIFIGIERVDASLYGKTNPLLVNPALVRMCRIYWKKLGN